MSRIPNTPPLKDKNGNYIKPKPPKNTSLPPGFKMKDYRYGLREIVVTPQDYEKLYYFYSDIGKLLNECVKQNKLGTTVIKSYFFGLVKKDVFHPFTKQEVENYLHKLLGDNIALSHFFEVHNIKYDYEEYGIFTNKYRTALGDIIALCDVDKETTIYATPDMTLVYKLILGK